MRAILSALCPIAMLCCATAALAQQSPIPGFEVHRYQATPAGESSFMVDTPRFAAGTWSAGLSLDYAHRPLVLGIDDDHGEFKTLQVIIQYQVLGNLDLAGSFCDCMTFSASVPFTLLERGPSPAGTSSSTAPLSLLSAASRPLSAAALETPTGIIPVSGLGASDPRVGAMMRLYGQPGESPFSASVGGSIWVPVRKFFEDTSSHTSDLEARMMAKLVLDGTRNLFRWSFMGAFLLRPEAHVGDLPLPEGSTAGSEVQLGAGLHYVNPARGFSIGPEARYSTVVTPRDYAFKPFYSSLEVLLGLHARVGQRLRLGVAGGAGVQRQPGTPDFRLMVRLSYDAVRRSAEARLPEPPRVRAEPTKEPVRISLSQLPQELSVKPERSPEELRASLDRDGDGVMDVKDVCPDTLLGDTPDPKRLGCPVVDEDQDGISDAEDTCPSEPGTPSLDAKVNGCPLSLVELKEDRILTRQPIVFAVNTDVLLAESLPVMQALANAIQDHPEIQKLHIEGHTDNSGSADFNRSLSLRRAESVRRWLVEHDIDAARLEATGFGPNRPIADNTTEAGRAANRRVDFVIAARAP